MVYLIFFIVSCVFLCSYLAFQYYDYQREYLNYEINGTIESFYVDSKKYPTVKVKGKDYSFVYGWNRDIKIQIGDSIHKNAGTRQLELFDEKGNLKFHMSK